MTSGEARPPLSNPSPAPGRLARALAPARIWIRELSLAVWILIGFVAVYVEVMSAYCYLRFPTFYTNTWDLGIFQQSLWTTAHGGRLFYYTAELPWNSSGSLLGVHWSPILFLVVPFYAALPGPLTLVVIQSIVVGASAFPLYAICRRRTNSTIALTLAILYLVSPPIIGAQLYDFHVESFLPVTGLTLIAAWEAKRYRLAGFSAALLLCTIEFAPLILGAIALEFFLRRARALWPSGHGMARYRRIAQEAWVPGLIVLAAVPLTILWFSFPKIISPYTPGINQVGPLSGSVVQIFHDLFTQPRLVGQSIASMPSHKLHYLWGLLLSAGVVWPLAPLDVLPALPWLLVALIGTDGSYSTAVGNQYPFLVVPFLFPATASALGWMMRPGSPVRRGMRWGYERTRLFVAPGRRPDSVRTVYRRRRPRARVWVERIGFPTVAVVIGVLAVTAPAQYMLSPFSPTDQYPWLGTGVHPNGQDRVLAQILGMIPANASVSAQPDLFPQVADRLNAYPYYEPGTQFLVVNIDSFWFTSPMPPPDPPLIWYNELRENVSSEYGVLASGDGGLLYERGYTGSPQFLIPDSTTIHPSNVTLANSTYVPFPSAPLGAYIEPNQSLRYADLWTGPNFLIPPGVYSVNVYLRNAGLAAGAIQLSISIDHGNLVVAKTLVESSDLSSVWRIVTLSVTVGHPAYVSLDGNAVGAYPTVQFGGAVFNQLDATSILE